MLSSVAKSIIVYGAGAWGTALACVLSRMGHHVSLLFRRKEHLKQTLENRVNPYLPSYPLPLSVQCFIDPSLVEKCDVLFWVIPAQFVRKEMLSIAPHISSQTPIVLCSKGIVVEKVMGRSSFLDAQVASILTNPLFILSGPNLAHEVAQGLPAAATLAHNHPDILEDFLKDFQHPSFRLYGSMDCIGVQLAGSLKNVYAIAAGICLGKSLGTNAHAALLTRSLAEMQRLGLALGAKTETFQGLSAIGDLILTATNVESRNMSFGYALGQGQSKEDILRERKSVTEGVYTTQSAFHLAQHLNIRMPILASVYSVLYQDCPIDTAITKLLEPSHRPFENI